MTTVETKSLCVGDYIQGQNGNVYRITKVEEHIVTAVVVCLHADEFRVLMLSPQDTLDVTKLAFEEARNHVENPTQHCCYWGPITSEWPPTNNW